MGKKARAQARVLAGTATPTDLLHGLAQVRTEIERLNNQQSQLVAKARQHGHTWTEIGYALGVSAQAVQKRYGATQ